MMIAPGFLRCGLLCVVVSASASAVSLAIVPNGSFEDDANRDGCPDGWRSVRFKSPGTAAWDHDVAHSGNASVRLADSAHAEDTGWDTNSVRWILTHSSRVEPSQTLTAEGWVRTDLRQGEAKVVLAWFAGSTWLHEDGSAGVRGILDWSYQTVTAQAPETATHVSIYLMLNHAKGSAWFDDVRAFRGDAPPGNFRPLGLRGTVNVGFRDEVAGDGRGGWTDQGHNDLRHIDPGVQVLRGIPFDIIEPARNEGLSCLVLKGRARADVPAWAAFDVGMVCDVLYFLHAAAWAGSPGTRVAEYILRYADGTQHSLAVRTDTHITDWWQPADHDHCAGFGMAGYWATTATGIRSAVLGRHRTVGVPWRTVRIPPPVRSACLPGSYSARPDRLSNPACRPVFV